ncbi:hypothetical protein VRK_28610 [Vibrio sp. MEBiC08052]|nr:hypothetical protein VRK_28610 [Vibrio sp. MEBiC08052]
MRKFGFLSVNGDFWNGGNMKTRFLKMFHPIKKTIHGRMVRLFRAGRP